MNTATARMLKAFDEDERIHIAEQLLADAGFASLLPSLTPLRLALPETEAHALAAVGLGLHRDTAAQAEAARVRQAMTFLDLYRQSETPNATAARLGVDPSRIRQRIREHSLLAIEMNDERRLPLLQFDGDVEIPGVAKLVAATWRKMEPLAFAMWFTTPTADLAVNDDEEHALSPRDWLRRTGDVGTVLALAESL